MNGRRQEAKERARLRKERARKILIEAKLVNSEAKDANGPSILVDRDMRHDEDGSTTLQPGQAQLYTEGSDSDTERSGAENSETTDSETIL